MQFFADSTVNVTIIHVRFNVLRSTAALLETYPVRFCSFHNKIRELLCSVQSVNEIFRIIIPTSQFTANVVAK